LVLIHFSAFMKQSKKKIEQEFLEEHIQFLQHLRDENHALNKLIKKLEEREHLKSKLVDKQHPEV
jgi:hypothetical protein